MAIRRRSGTGKKKAAARGRGKSPAKRKASAARRPAKRSKASARPKAKKAGKAAKPKARAKAKARPKAAAKAKPKPKPKPEAKASPKKPAAKAKQPARVKQAPAAAKTGKQAGATVARKPARAVAVVPAVQPIGMLPANVIARSNARPATLPPRPPQRVTSIKPATSQGVESVTEEDIKDLELRLLEERRRILKEMGHLETTVFKVNQRDSSGDLSGYAFHMADAGTDAMEREKAFLFASAEGRTLMEIDEALRRLYKGEYGVCESCGQAIGRPRLMAIPQARLCLKCKEKEERTGRSAM
jgi:RNA polymerase-binding transcription factor DksA